ncbi:MAG: PepSY domain-containing protein [Coriobacteriia bacterium]|nr:PepSY domain-containing protein [Coriobacteriia bacterium]
MANKKLLALIASMALVAAMALAGCGGSQPAPSSSSAPESTAASSAAAEESSSAAAEASASSSAAAPAASSQSSDAYIGEDAALEAALKHAGVNQADATEQQVELDTDDATVHYEVEFKSAGTEYSYDIDAATGEVMNFESEADDD